MDASRSFVQPANFEDRERDLIERIRREEERAKREQEIGETMLKREREFGETMLKREREVAIELQKSNEKSMEIKDETSQAMLKREREVAMEQKTSNEKSLDIYKEEVLHRRSLEHTQKSVELALLLFGKANESNPETLQAFTPLLGSLLSRGPESK